MTVNNWIRASLAVISLTAAGFLVACSDADGDSGSEGATGGSPTAEAEPTDTPTPLNDATSTPENLPGGGETPAPPSFPASDEPPVTTASSNGETVDTGIGTFCWTRLCADKIGVPTRGELTVSRGDVVTVAIPDGTPPFREAYVNAFEAVDAQDLDDGSDIWPYPGSPGEGQEFVVAGDAVEVSVNLEPGRYVLAVGMFFEGADVVYGVLVTVQ